MNGLELSQKYYETYGAPMLHEQFALLEEIVAVALCGSGSECFGFDDEVSRDLDFEPGFCLFLPGEEVIDRRTAFLLERAYAKLPKTFLGFERAPLSPVGGNRHGVMRMDDFFCAKVGVPDGRLTTEQWLTTPEFYLAEATNGAVFRDDCGAFTAVRERLKQHCNIVSHIGGFTQVVLNRLGIKRGVVARNEHRNAIAAKTLALLLRRRKRARGMAVGNVPIAHIKLFTRRFFFVFRNVRRENETFHQQRVLLEHVFESFEVRRVCRVCFFPFQQRNHTVQHGAIALCIDGQVCIRGDNEAFDRKRVFPAVKSGDNIAVIACRERVIDVAEDFVLYSGKGIGIEECLREKPPDVCGICDCQTVFFN